MARKYSGDMKDVEPDPHGARLFRVGKDPEHNWAAHPGALSPDQWHAQATVAYHGTAVEDPSTISGPTHFGSFGLAQGMARKQAKARRPGQHIGLYNPEYGPDDSDEPDSEQTIGRTAGVLARRLPQQDPVLYSDAAANQAHIESALNRQDYVAESIWGSAHPSAPGVARATRSLDEGKAIRYRNEAETAERFGSALTGGPRGHRPLPRFQGDRPDVSHVARMEDTRSYAEDVEDAQREGYSAHPLAHQYINAHQFGSVPVEEKDNWTDRSQQPLFGDSTWDIRTRIKRMPGFKVEDTFEYTPYGS